MKLVIKAAPIAALLIFAGCSPTMMLDAGTLATGAVNASLASEREAAGVGNPSFLDRMTSGISGLFGGGSGESCYRQLLQNRAQLEASAARVGKSAESFAREQCNLATE